MFFDLGLLSQTETFIPQIVTVKLETVTPDVALGRTLPIDGSDPQQVLLPVTEFPGNQQWVPNQQFQALQLGPPPRAVVSVVRPDFVAAVFESISPEVRNGTVRIMGISRAAGLRTKVAVASTEPGLDAIAACIGRRASRVRYAASILDPSGKEKVDIVAWHPDPDTYLANAFAPATVTKAHLDEETQTATVYVPAHQMPAAIGGHGLNTQLAGQLVGMAVTVEPET